MARSECAWSTWNGVAGGEGKCNGVCQLLEGVVADVRRRAVLRSAAGGLAFGGWASGPGGAAAAGGPLMLAGMARSTSYVLLSA